jgi:hypothetical protein
MTQQVINVGAAPNDGTGDPARTAFTKTNSNFTELYSSVTAGTANGVAYYNASGALSSGTGLTYGADGNLGLGVTPSAWGPSGTYTALQIGPAGGGGAQVNLAGGDASLGSNFYISAVGTARYQSTGIGATKYQFYNGVHSWSTAPAGTAGNAITFTERMSIASAGNVTINAPTSGQALAMTGIAAGTAALTINTSATTGAQTATFTATNKPGSGTTAPSKWLPVILDGTTYYIPAWT